jgi:membrane protease YdiL (CAAX protease family)
LSGPDRPRPVEADESQAADGRSGGPAPRPGARTFTIEGRAAPGLFVAGWLATILGGVTTFVGLAAEPSAAKIVLLLGGLIGLALGLLAGAGSQAMERRARGARFGGPSPFLTFAASVPIALLVANLVALPLLALGMDPDSPVSALIQVMATATIYLALVRMLVVDVGAMTWIDMGIRRIDREALAAFAGGAIYAAPAILATGLVAIALSGFLPIPPSPLPIGTDAAGISANLVAAAVFAPLGEELFFRGYATSAWMRVYGGRRALIQGALFFAFVHVLGVTGSTAGEAIGAATTAFIARLPISLMLGWVFMRRGSLWASVGLHSTFNLVLVVIAILGGQMAGAGPALVR